MSYRATDPSGPALLKPDSTPASLSFPNPTGKSEHEGIIALITLNAPERLNAVRSEDMRAIAETLQWIAAQDKVVFTVITGRGRFFSAGADVKDPSRAIPPEAEKHPEGSAERRVIYKNHILSRFATGNLSLGESLHRHPKILVGAMNGPAVGICATMLGHCDLLYTHEDFWLSTPFMGLALVSEGLAALTFAKKMGLGRAQVALLEGKRMDAKDLRQSGFVTHIFDKPSPPAGTSAKDKHYTPPILDQVLSHLADKFLPPTLDPFSLIYTKELLRAANYDGWDATRTNMEEIRGAEQVFGSGRPQKQFERIKNGGRHKL